MIFMSASAAERVTSAPPPVKILFCTMSVPPLANCTKRSRWHWKVLAAAAVGPPIVPRTARSVIPRWKNQAVPRVVPIVALNLQFEIETTGAAAVVVFRPSSCIAVSGSEGPPDGLVESEPVAFISKSLSVTLLKKPKLYIPMAE